MYTALKNTLLECMLKSQVGTNLKTNAQLTTMYLILSRTTFQSSTIQVDLTLPDFAITCIRMEILSFTMKFVTKNFKALRLE